MVCSRLDAMAEQQYRCRGCGAPVQYEPGTEAFRCPYCGAEQAFQAATGALEEQPYSDALAEALAKEPTEERLTVKCASCGAQFSFPDNVVGDRCSFCGSPIVATGVSTRTIRPRAVLPFKIGAEQAASAFRAWVASLWFAPGALRRDARGGKIDGVYLPYWTFDAKTSSTYTGQRGTNYTETETYSTTEGGQAVTRTRQVTKVRWSTVAGQVARDFDDVLVVAGRSLPAGMLDELEPWDLAELAPASDEYLAGYRVESYTIPLQPALTTARQKMKGFIERDVASDIGGDHQRILSLATEERDVTFKHVLLPLWLSGYRFGRRTYRFIVNARTGEVQGERPWSWIKITLAVLGVIVAVWLLVHVAAR
jgi:LSD1 subclass zinc finger protein